MQQHRPICLQQDVFTHLDLAVGGDPEDVGIERRVMELAQCDAIRNRWNASWVAIGQNVRCLEQLLVTQPTDGAVHAVRGNYSLTERALVQAFLDRRGDVPSCAVARVFSNVIGWRGKTDALVDSTVKVNDAGSS
jgi:hypothetical protein